MDSKNKNRWTTINIPKSLARALEREARLEGRLVANFARVVLEREIENRVKARQGA